MVGLEAGAGVGAGVGAGPEAWQCLEDGRQVKVDGGTSDEPCSKHAKGPCSVDIGPEHGRPGLAHRQLQSVRFRRPGRTGPRTRPGGDAEGLAGPRRPHPPGLPTQARAWLRKKLAAKRVCYGGEKLSLFRSTKMPGVG